MEMRERVIELSADHVLSFLLRACFTELGWRKVISHVSLHNLYKLILNIFHGEEELQAQD